jgi:uncharacterized membrane protein YqjE
MSERIGPAGRLVEAVCTSSTLLLELVATRLALFASEVDIELARIRASAVLLFCAMTCFGLMLALLALLVIAAFWDTYRLPAIALTALALLIAGCGFALGVRRRVSRGIPFAMTLQELREDCRALRHESGE